VRLIVRTSAFFRCPSPEDATVNVIVFSSPSSSTRARFATAMPGPDTGGSLRTDMEGGCWRRSRLEGDGDVEEYPFSFFAAL
jgi:hypothetical protein